MKYKGKFYQTFNTSRMFDDGTLVISSELYTRKEAIDEIYIGICKDDIRANSELLGVIDKNLEEGFVRYGIKTTIDGITSAWWICEKSRGAKPVYMVDERILRKSIF